VAADAPSAAAFVGALARVLLPRRLPRARLRICPVALVRDGNGFVAPRELL